MSGSSGASTDAAIVPAPLQTQLVGSSVRHNKLHCGACKQPCDMISTRPRGHNPLLRWHVSCLSAWKTFQSRMTKKPKLKVWWMNMDEDQQADWFVVNSKSSKKDSFGERVYHCIGYEEEIIKEVGQEKRIRDEGVPWSEYMKQQKGLGIQMHEIKLKWKEMLEDPHYEKEVVRGVTVIYFFKGVVRDSVDREMFKQSQKRSRQCSTEEELASVIKDGDEEARRVRHELQQRPLAPTLDYIGNQEEDDLEDSDQDVDFSSVKIINSKQLFNMDIGDTVGDTMRKVLVEGERDREKKENALREAAEREAALCGVEKVVNKESLAMAKVTMIAKFEGDLAALNGVKDTKILEMSSKMAELSSSIADHSGASDEQIRNQTKLLKTATDECEAKIKEARAAMTKLVGNKDKACVKLQEATTMEAADVAKLDFESAMKDFKAGELRTLDLQVKVAVKVKAKVEKEIARLMKSCSKGSGGVVSSSPKTLERFFGSLNTTLASAGNINVGAFLPANSLNNLTGKAKLCALPKETSATLREDAYVAKAIKWQRKHAIDNKETVVITSVTKAQQEKAWTTLMEKGLPEGAFKKLRLTRKFEAAEQNAFTMQIMSGFAGHGLGSLAPFGMPQAFVLIDGEIDIAGVLQSQVHGDTLDKKMTALSKMGTNEKLQLIKDHGFRQTMDASGNTLFIPEGYIVISWVAGKLPDAGATLLRWSFWADSTNKDLVIEAADSMLKTHEFLEGEGYKLWIDGLTTFFHTK